MNEVRLSNDFYTNGDGYLSSGYMFPEFSDNLMAMQGYTDNLTSSPTSMDRKRKEPMEGRGGFSEDAKQMRLMHQEDKKFGRQNHSEIEKRRRDKMNTYISELSSMIPTCVAMQRKMDKLTVLRLAVQHVKSIRGSLDSYAEANYKPPMLSDRELKQLIVANADGFMFVVDSARTRILYVSDSVSEILNFSPQDLIGQSLFDILHPKDIDKVKEQLSNYDSTPRERLIDSKTLLPLKGDIPLSTSRLHPGARRAFFCRMKCKPAPTTPIKQEEDISPSPLLNSSYSPGSCPSSSSGKKKKLATIDKRYLSIQCTGYLKSWPLTKVTRDTEITDHDGDPDSCISCLVAVGRMQPSFQNTLEDCLDRGKPTANGVEFFSRHGTDGKFTYVDQRVTPMLGFLPQELLGTSLYEHIQYDDIPVIAECHRCTLKTNEEHQTPFFRFRTKEGKFVRLESKWKQFRNPWTKEIEYILCKNYLLITQEKIVEGGGTFSDGGGLDFFSGRNGTNGSTTPGTSNTARGLQVGKNIQNVISSHTEAAKIGKHIADEMIERSRYDSSASNSPLSSLQNENQLLREAMAEVEQDRNKLSGVIVSRTATTSGFSQTIVRPAANTSRNLSLTDQIMRGALNSRKNSPPSSSHSSEGNDEAATAVLMSLLEAEGGLGGPFDFANLPWPLP